MATLEQLQSALVGAHEAGDTAAATAIATELKRMSPKAEARSDDPGAMQAGLIGAGRVFDRMAAGLKDAMPQSVQAAVDAVGQRLGMAKMDASPEEQAYRTKAYSKVEQQHPVATFVGEAAPLVAGLPAVGSVGGAAALSAVPGMLEYGTPEERLTRGAMGAVGGGLGAGLGKAVGRVLNPIRGEPTSAVQEAMQAADSIGYKVPVGQQTGNRAVQAIEQQLAKNPFSSKGAQGFNDANQQAINRAAAKAMGADAPHLTDEVLGAAKTRIGEQFDAIAARNTIKVDGDELMNALIKLDAQQKALGKFAQPKVSSLVDKGLDLAAKGNVEGQTYQVIRSELGKQAESAFANKNSTLGEALKTVQRSLDDAANNSISAADRQAWQTARQQYQAYKLVSKKGQVVEGGNVSAARLASKLDNQRGSVPAELAAIGKIGETFKPLPDSGTAGNAMTQMLLSGGAGLMGPGALATSILAPIASQKALMSKAGQKYLMNGLLKVTPEMEKRLMQAGGGLLGLSSLGLGR